MNDEEITATAAAEAVAGTARLMHAVRYAERYLSFCRGEVRLAPARRNHGLSQQEAAKIRLRVRKESGT